MANLGELIVIYDLLPEMAEKLDTVLSQLVRKAAFDVQAIAQNMAPIEFGFLKSSIYVRTNTSSGYGNIESPTRPGAFILPEVEKPAKNHATIAVGATYGVYQEFGTTKMAAHPYMTPAADMVRPQFEAALEKIEALMAAV